MLTGIKRTPLQSEIIKYIQDYIKQEGLVPGDKLPSQASLIEMMGVSRTSLREAIKTLEAKNILEVKNGKGIFVRDTSDSVLLSQIEFSKEKECFLEMLEARKILEKEIVRLVVKNVTDEELDKIGEVLSVIMEKYHRGEKQNKEDKQFHYMVYECSHNRVMHQLIQSISSMLDQCWNFPLDMESPFTETMPLHVDFYNALRARDVKKAQETSERILNMMVRDVEKQR